MYRPPSILRSGLMFGFLLVFLAQLAPQALAWEREPNSVFAERRAKLIAAAGAPVVIFGYTGHEEANPSYVFMQEENFYYLTGHNEEGAALLLVPESAAQKGWTGPREILYLPPRDPAQEKWNGPRMGPDDPAIKEKTGFADVEVFTKLHETLANLGRDFPEIYTELPGPHEEGYPHAANWANWIKGAVSHVTLKDVSPAVGTLRAIKSSGELALIQKAIDPSIDAPAALKPGMMMGGQGSNSLQKIAMDYIDSHGKDKEGRTLGRYYIHGLSHHVGLNVHDSSGPPRPLEPGMVITIEPGIYIPEENIGVRIEDDVLITPTGYKMLTARLPRSPDEIEKIMAEGKAEGEKRVR